MAVLTRDTLLSKQKLKIEEVRLGNGDSVFIREMTGLERDAYDQTMHKRVKGKDGTIVYEQTLDNFRAKLAVAALCDKGGMLLLKLTDASCLAESISAKHLEIIVDAVQALNGIGTKKNSKATFDADSTSNCAES